MLAEMHQLKCVLCPVAIILWLKPEQLSPECCQTLTIVTDHSLLLHSQAYAEWHNSLAH